MGPTVLLGGAPIYDRQREQQELDRAWTSGKPELLIAAGRRRAGKSYLLSHYLQGKRGLYYQATKTTSKDQLRTISQVVATQFPQAGLKFANGFADWDKFFDFIVQEANNEPFLLVLDELPYMIESIKGFGTLLQRVWDHTLPPTKIKLVLSGSYISAMRRLTTADQPLHGRKTGSMGFAPFSYWDAASFVPHYTAYERLVAYATFGGLPGHIANIDPAESVARNVGQHMLRPGGRLADEAEHLFDAFLRDAGVHYSIVRAIAGGEHKWGKIMNAVGKETSSMTRPLEWLQEMDVVTRVIPITDAPTGKSRKAMYRISDPYLAFWHRFVAPLRASGAEDLMEPDALWQQFIAPQLNDYMGPVFEAACRVFVGRHQHPRLPFQPVRIGEWWSDDSQEQVDVVALGPDGDVLIGECKWGTVDRHDLATLERRRDLIVAELTGVSRVYLATFGGNPVTDPTLRARIDAGDVLHYALDDLY